MTRPTNEGKPFTWAVILAVMLILFVVAGKSLRNAERDGTPACTVSDPCPSPTPYPGGWKPSHG